jgi:hypothetical protein
MDSMHASSPPTRHRSPAGRALGVAAVAVCLLALGCSGQPAVPTTAPVAPASAVTQPGAAHVAGRVTLPEDLVGAHQVIPTGIGRVIPTGMGRYRVAAVAELPVTGATVTALDPATRAPIAGVPATTTDEAGAFTLTGLAPDAEVLIAVTFRPRGGEQDFRLLAIARASVPAEAPRPVPPTDVTWRSTAAVTEHLTAHAGAYVPAAPDALAAREAALAEQAAALNPGERLAVITRAVLAPLLPATPAPGAGGTAPSASSAPTLPLPSPLASTLTGVTQTVAGTTKPVTDVTQTVVSGATQTVTAPLASALPVVGAVVQPVTGVVSGTLGLLPTPTPTSTPTPKPSSTPLLGLPLPSLF